MGRLSCKYISESLGNQTIEYSTSGQSQSSSEQGSSSSSQTTEHRHSRPLLTPDEIRTMPSGMVVVLEQGMPPQLPKRLNYLVDPECQNLFDHNPMHRAAALPNRAAAMPMAMPKKPLRLEATDVTDESEVETEDEQQS